MFARVIHIITKLELGGAQQNTLYTVERLDRSRFSAALWAGDGGILNEDARKIPDLDFQIVPPLVREVRPGKDWAAFSCLTRMLKEEVKKADVPVIVHTHSSKAGILGRWAAWRAKVPVVIHSFHGFGFNDFQPWPVKAAYIAAERLTGKITDHVIAVSQANLDRAVSLGLARPDHIQVIRSGIKIAEFERVGRPDFNPATSGANKFAPTGVGGPDLNRADLGANKFAPTGGRPDFSRDQKMRELGLDPENPLVLMVACLKPQKSPVDFVLVAERVAKEVPAARFAVAGDGELMPEMEKAIADRGLAHQIKLLGWRRDVPELLACANVLALTSLWEGLPRVYPQAMAAGVPIVGTRVDGGAEAVQDGENGWLLAPHDVDGLAKRIIELLNDPAQAQAMGQAGRRLVAPFDIDLMVQEQEELYEKLVRNKA